MTFDEMKALEGKRVRVILDELDPQAYVDGVLELLDEYGQVQIRNDDGTLSYAWPALDMELLEED